MSESFHGYKNLTTWHVVSFFGSDDEVLAVVDQLVDQSRSKSELAKMLEHFCKNLLVSKLLKSPNRAVWSLQQTLLSDALEDVDWLEAAEQRYAIRGKK